MNKTIDLTPDYSQLAPRQQGRMLFAQGFSVTEIAALLSATRSTVESWRNRDKWKLADIYDDVTMGLRARLLLVIGKDQKSNADYKELDALFRQLERTARIERYRHGGTESDLNPKLLERNASARKKKLKNQISDEQLAVLEKAFRDKLFAYQKEWVDSVESCQQAAPSCNPLPADFEQLAFEIGAFTRARKIKTSTQLIMLYCGQDLSLRSCAGQFAYAHGALSDMGVKKD